MVERIRYELSKCHLKSERLVMGYIIRNESDIIEPNIRLHASLGVDAFIVFDHLSNDETPDIVQRLALELPIHYVRKTDALYKQCEWSTEIVRLAKQQFSADWVIVNDADEFWIPREGSDLKQCISNDFYVGRVNRYNMLPNAEQLDSGAFHLFDTIVINPITYFDSNQKFALPTRELLEIQRIKLLVRPEGLLRMKPGNHRATHLGMRRKFNAEGIRILHYPIRSKRQLERKLQLQGETYAAQQQLSKLKEGTGGPHLHRLLCTLNHGDAHFRDFCDSLLPSAEQFELLMSLGITERDFSIPRLFGPIISQCGRASPRRTAPTLEPTPAVQ